MRPVERAEQGEEDADDGEDAGRPARLADQRGHQPAEGAGPIEEGERAADEEDDDEDLGAVDHAARDGERRLQRTERGRLDPVVGPGDRQRAAGRRIDAAIELARGHHPGEQRGDDDAGEQQDERMRKPAARGVALGHGPPGQASLPAPGSVAQSRA